MTATAEITRLQDGGFSPEEIEAWGMTQRKHLSEAGFSQGEIDGYFGQPPFNPTPIKAHVDEVMKAATHPTTEGGQPRPVMNFTDALKAGFGESVTGLLMGKPTEVLAPDAPRSSRIAASVGTLAGDVPAMVGGYMAGGANPITGTAGAFALPAGIRKILMDKYENGEVQGFGDFWDRFSGAFIDTAKGWITGAATGAVGKVIGGAPIASPTVKAASTLTGEIATMVTVGNALEGKMPEPDDFIDTALTLGFVKGSAKIASKLRTIYAETGVKPDEVAQDIQRDPTILHDLASDNVEIPKVYREAEVHPETAPTVETLHALAASKGMQWDNNPAFMDLTESVTGKRHLDALTPAERQELGEAIAEMEPSHPQRFLLSLRGALPIPKTPLALPVPKPVERPPQEGQQSIDVPPPTIGERPIIGREVSPEDDAPLFNESQRTPAAEQTDIFGRQEPLPRFELAQTPRHLMQIDQNAEMLARAEKAVADMEIASQERGTRVFQETQGRGSDQEVTGLKSATAEWYKQATTGERKLSQRRVEVALRKIIEGKGRDVGTDVQRIKELLLGDAEFERSEFSPKNEEEWERARQYAVVEWEPDLAMGGGAPPRKPRPSSNQPVGEAQRKVLDRLVLTDPKTERLTFADVYTSIIDNLNPIKQALKEGGKAGLPTAKDPYSLERLTRGNMGKGEAFIKYGAFDFETYETVTKGYEEILKPVKKDLDGFRAYMVAKRAIEKAEQGIETGIPLEEAKTVVLEGRDKYESVHRERVQYREAMLTYLQKSGILSEKSVEAMRAANKEYVPFYRFFEEPDKARPTKGSGGSPIKRMTGSERQILDPIVSDVKDTFLFIALAEKNAARQAYAALGPEFAVKQKSVVKPIALTEPEIRRVFDEFMTMKKQTQKTSTSTTTTTGATGAAPTSKQTELVVAKVKEALIARGYHAGEADQYIRRVGEAEAGKVGATIEKITKEIESTTFIQELDIRLPNEAAQVWRTIKQPLAADEISVFTNGKREVYKVDPKVADAFEDLDRVSSNIVAKMLFHAPASLLRAGVTITPDFMMRNIVRDAISGFIFAGSHPIRTALGLKSVLTHDTAFQKWMKGGGANATMVSMDRDYIQKNLVDLNVKTGLMQRAWNVARTPLDILRATSELVENATRLGAVRPELLKAQDKATIQALALIAREATVDFSRHGRETQEFAKITAFFNPAVQGIDRMNRAFKDAPLATTAKAVGAITLPSVLLWYANKDDKEIQDLPRWQKDLFWIVRVPTRDGGSFLLRVPKPFEIGIVFGSLPERLLDAYVKETPNTWRDIEESMLQAFLPSMIPTTAVPVIGQFANRSTFTGGPIVPLRSEGLLPEYQYTPYTTETAKAIGQLIGAFPGMESAAVRSHEPFIGGIARALTSPVLLENYVRSWTGGMGMYLLQLADKGLREAGAVPDPVKSAWAVADIPVVKAFIVRYPSANAQSIQDFYRDYAASKVYFDTIMHLAKEGDSKASALIETHSEDLAQLSGIHEAVGQQAQLVQMIDKNQQITPEEKRQLIDTLYYRMIELAQAGNTALRTVKDTVKK